MQRVSSYRRVVTSGMNGRPNLPVSGDTEVLETLHHKAQAELQMILQNHDSMRRHVLSNRNAEAHALPSDLHAPSLTHVDASG